MESDIFFENFGDLVEAPGSIPRLREMILQLAVMGKLVEQDPDDEPASVLIEKIREERERLVKERKIRTRKPLPEIREEMKPFEIPRGGKWVRLGEASRLRRGFDLPKSKRIAGQYPVYGANGPLGTHNGFGVAGPGIVTGRSGSIGKVHYVRGDFWPLNTALYVEDFFGNEPRFIELLLRSARLERFSSFSAVPTLNRNVAHLEPVCIPPLAEQHRIVTKVDKLMSICDQLEAQKHQATNDRRKLNTAAIHELLKPQDPVEFEKKWQFIHANFQLLYNDPENVKELRQAILQLAVMGRLVEQDPDDESAGVLLEKIRVEKERLVGEGKIRKQKILPPIEADEVPFAVPVGWEWLRMGDITNYGQSEKAESKDIPNDAWLLDLEDIESYTSVLLRKKSVIEARPSSSKNVFWKNDVLYMKLRPYLNKVIVADDDGYCSSELLPLRVYGGYCSPTFLKTVIQAPLFVKMVNEKTYGMKMPRLGTNDGRRALIPFAPLNEQNRIVAKVDKLMSLCGQLETKIEQSQDHSVKLLNAVIHEVLAA